MDFLSLLQILCEPEDHRENLSRQLLKTKGLYVNRNHELFLTKRNTIPGFPYVAKRTAFSTCRGITLKLAGLAEYLQNKRDAST
jgi:hypothetical protein